MPYGSMEPDAAGVRPDLDRIEELADRIATLAAHISAAEYRFLTLIAEFDRLRGWEALGHPSCAHWLHARTGLNMGTARERVRAARALEQLPLTREAMSRGRLSLCQVRALTRVATRDNEAELLPYACGATVGQLERMVRGWKKGSRKDEAEWERERYQSRSFSVFPDEDGMYVVRGRLTPELGALLMRAVEAASDALFQGPRIPGVTDDSEREAAQRRADAVGLLAERALAAGFVDDDAPISGSRAQRYQVVLHVEPGTLTEEGEPGTSELEDGTRVSCETSRRLCCDGSVVKVSQGKDGSVLDVGRKTRTVSPALRRALEVRDRGCRFPGCGRRFTDAHHVKHWADGGETSLANCLLLCKFHHRLVHEGGWRIVWWGAGKPMFFRGDEEMRFDGSWQPPQLPDDAAKALIEENRAHGINPDEWTASARWKHEENIPNEVYFRALEAL